MFDTAQQLKFNKLAKYNIQFSCIHNILAATKDEK